MLVSAQVLASDIKLPRETDWMTTPNGSTAYNQINAIRTALRKATRSRINIMPAANDLDRHIPLRRGEAQFAIAGLGGSFGAQEGVLGFADRRWGPQPVRMILSNNAGVTGLAVAVTRETCNPDCDTFTYADLKGKRIAWFTNAPILNVHTTAYLAYAGLTWGDVRKAEFENFGNAWAAMRQGSVDAAFAATHSGRAYEQAASAPGIFWPRIDPENEDSIERMQAIAPYLEPVSASFGAGIDGGPPLPTAAHAYPVLIARERLREGLVYNMTRALVETFDDYKDATPDIGGWALDKQDLTWLIPYHAGAVRYFREAGKWSIREQRHNHRLIRRQQILQTAWEELKAEKPKDWRTAWKERRKTVLKAAGYEPIF